MKQRAVHLEPGDAPPRWTLDWVNVWIDHRGGSHWSRYTHGSAFEAAFATAYGRPTGVEENSWMLEKVGSVGDGQDDEDDNPGWQFNEMADHKLGWIRLKAYGLGSLQPRWTVKFGEPATAAALAAAIRLLSAQPRQALCDIETTGSWSEDLPLGRAMSELKGWAGEAPGAAAVGKEDDTAPPETAPAP